MSLIKVGASGVWKDIAGLWVGSAGVWKAAQAVHAGNGGAWKASWVPDAATITVVDDPSGKADGNESSVWSPAMGDGLFLYSGGKFRPNGVASASYYNAQVFGTNQKVSIVTDASAATLRVTALFVNLQGTLATPNGFRADNWMNGTVRLIRLNNGDETGIDSVSGITFAPGDVFELERVGTAIYVRKNSTVLITASVGTTFNGNGYVGKSCYSSGGTTTLGTFTAIGDTPVSTGSTQTLSPSGFTVSSAAGSPTLVVAAASGGGQTFSGRFLRSKKEPGVNGWFTWLTCSPHDSNVAIISGDLFGSAITFSGGLRWDACTTPGNDEGGAATFHPTNPLVIWRATARGPYRSTDGGTTWTWQRNGMPTPTTTPGTGLGAGTYNLSAVTSHVRFDPSNSATIYAYGGSVHRINVSIYGTDDADPRWNNGVVWRCTNGEDTTPTWAAWGSVPGNPSIRNVEFCADGNTVLVTTRTGVYRSTNKGHDFTAFNSGLSNAWSTFGLAVHPTNADVAFVCDIWGNIYKSTNVTSSCTWTRVLDAGDGDYVDPLVSVRVSPQNPNVVYAAAHSGIWMSAGSGNSGTWSNVLSNSTLASKLSGGNPYGGSCLPTVTAIDPRDPNGNTFWMCGDTIIAKTTDRGTTWTNMAATPAGAYSGWHGNGYTGDVSNINKWNPFRASQFFALGYDANKAVRTDDYGYSWLTRISGVALYNGGNDVAFSGDGTIYLGTGQGGHSDLMPGGSGEGAILKSTDWGSTWAYVALPSGVSAEVLALHTLPGDSSKVWAGTSNGLILKSTNGGASWTTAESGIGRVHCFAPAPSDATGYTFYVGSAGDTGEGVRKTTADSAFVVVPGSPASGAGTFVAVDPTNASVIYVTQMFGGGLYKYNGSSWSNKLSSSFIKGVAVDPGNASRVAITTADSGNKDVMYATGLYISEDGGDTWENIQAGLPNLSLAPVAFNPDKSGQLVVGCLGGGCFVMDAGASTPYGGSARSIGAGTTTIQAEDYDDGGVGVAYKSGTGLSRSALTAVATGNWIKYKVAVTAGVYSIAVNGKSSTSGAKVHIEMNGVNDTGPLALSNTGSATTVSAPNYVELSGGTQYLKLYVEAGGADIDYIQFTKVA